MSKALFIAAALSIAALIGCASNKVPCLHDHKIVTAKTDSNSVRMPYVDVQHKKDTLEISGTLERRDFSSGPILAHVDISIFTEQGQLLKKVRTEDIHIPRHQVGKGPHWVRFKTVIPIDVQGNITVYAQPHSDSICEQ